MRSIPLRAALALLLLVLGMATQLDATIASSANTANMGWQHSSLLGRNSRNLLHRNSATAGGDLIADVGGEGGGGTFGLRASSVNNAGYNNDYAAQLFAPYDVEQQQQQQQQLPQQQPQAAPISAQLRHQQTEVYGIVEPLIEDTPCANRACVLNDDCCPTGVCVNTYGEGKCVYVFGHQRDLCQSHTDCAPGSACMIAPQEGIWRCATDAPLLPEILSVQPKQPLGSDCSSSSDCQVINGMCCQQQRLHHRGATKLSCGYFRDPFDCVNVAQEHVANIFHHRHN
ncbi:uncharacterized protein LOC117784174 [Drosophila innubila]|uniref:uncharacterized protein LOC117784174 n=1 Tax=Drosophila innubila TaxID=198719 RepID=UPI00148DD8ED|nr:uncharacterized protein LOC117784174 [Drosophila innubila]